MSGHGGEPEFKGLTKYFNSTTDLGRRNFGMATYAFMAGVALYYFLKPSTKAVEAPKAK